MSVWTHLSSFIIDGSVSTKIYFCKLNQSLSRNARLSAANDANEARLRLHFRPPPPDRLQNLGWKQNPHGPGWVVNESGLRRRGENADQLIHTGMKTSAAASHQPRLTTDEARRAVSHAAAIDRYRQPGSKEPRPAARLRPQTNKTAWRAAGTTADGGGLVCVLQGNHRSKPGSTQTVTTVTPER